MRNNTSWNIIIRRTAVFESLDAKLCCEIGDSKEINQGGELNEKVQVYLDRVRSYVLAVELKAGFSAILLRTVPTLLYLAAKLERYGTHALHGALPRGRK